MMHWQRQAAKLETLRQSCRIDGAPPEHPTQDLALILSCLHFEPYFQGGD